MKNRALTLFIVFLIVLQILSPLCSLAYYEIGNPNNANGSDYADGRATLAAKLNEIINGDIDIYTNSSCTNEMSMPLGFSFTNYMNTPFYVKSNATGTVSGAYYQCFAYANAVYNKLCGEWVGSGAPFSNSSVVLSGGNHMTYDRLKNAGVRCGAYLRSTGNSDGSYNGNNGHSIVILAYDSSTVTFINGNWTDAHKVLIVNVTYSQFDQYILSGMGRYLCHIVQPSQSWWDNAYPKGETGHAMSEGEAAGYTIPNGNYWISSKLDDDYYLDVPGRTFDTTNGTNLQMYHNHSTLADYDAFTIEYLDNGFYKIVQYNTNMCVDVQDGSLTAGANVQMYTSNGTWAQQWSISKTDRGYQIQSRCSSYFMDVSNASTTDGTNVGLWKSNGNTAQFFEFVPFTYTVTFKDWDSTILKTETVTQGQSATAPANPSRTGYTFIGWDKDFSNVKSDLTVTALYEKINEPTPTPTQQPTPTTTQQPTPTPTTAPTTAPTATPTQQPIANLGDLNSDGRINTADAVLVLKEAAGIINLTTEQLKCGDCNHDNKVNTADAVLILKYAAGMITTF